MLWALLRELLHQRKAILTDKRIQQQKNLLQKKKVIIDMLFMATIFLRILKEFTLTGAAFSKTGTDQGLQSGG